MPTLDTLQAGDAVAIVRHGLRGRIVSGPFKVERVTKTRIVLTSGSYFKRSTGGTFGSSVRLERIEPWSAEHMDEINAQHQVKRAENFLQRVAQSASRARGEDALNLFEKFPAELRAHFGDEAPRST